MSENKTPQQSNNVHSLKNKMSEDEWIKRQAAIEVERAIDTGNHHTISGIFRKPKDSYPKNVRSINPQMLRSTQLDLSFKNELPRSIAATENKTDAVSQALHETYTQLSNLYNAADEEYSPPKITLRKTCQIFYNEVRKYENLNTGAKNNEEEQEIKILKNIDTGKKIIEQIQTALESFTPESTQADLVDKITPLNNELRHVSTKIEHHNASLGQSTIKIT